MSRSGDDGLLGVASRLYARSFARCVPPALLGALAAAAAGAHAAAGTNALSQRFGVLLNTLANADLNAPDDALNAFDTFVARAHALVASPAVWASWLGAALIVLITHGALVARQNGFAHGRVEPLRALLWLLLRRLPDVLLALLILAAAGAGGVLVLLAAHAASLPLLLLTAPGVLLLALWLWGRLQLWLVAMFAEDLGALAALARSWRLVRGHWLRACALTAVPYLVIAVLSALSAHAAAAVGGWLGGDATSAARISGVLGLAAGIVTLPMLPAMWLALYERLRRLSAPAPPGTPP